MPTDAGSTDANDVNTDASAQVRHKGERKLGVDVNSAENEEFIESYNVSALAGTDYLTFPLNWSDIEPGPDDDFHYSALDSKKWRTTVTNATLALQDEQLRFEAAGNVAAGARTYTSYQLVSEEVSAQIDVDLSGSPVSGEATLLVRFGATDAEAVPCEDATDDFIALVQTSQAVGSGLVMAVCQDGAFASVATATNTARVLTLRIRRSATAIVAEYKEPSAAAFSELGSIPVASFTGSARPYLFGSNPASEAMVATMDNLHVSGETIWDTPSDRFSVNPDFDLLYIVNLVYSDLPIPMALSIRTINTVAVEIPSDLSVVTPSTGLVDFGSQAMETRFREFIEHTLGRLPDIDLASISIGNEIDGYLGDSDQAWESYIRFATEVMPHVRSAHPNGSLIVGVKGTLHGILAHPSEFESLNRVSDVIMVTYYPLRSDFSVEPTSSVHHDFDQIVNWASDNNSDTKEIWLQEVGYPSAPASAYCPNCNSSEQAQAEFIDEVFIAWDEHAERITRLNFNWLTDPSADILDEWTAYYDVAVPAFREFLGTLGYRNADGSEKLAWPRLQKAASLRGWEARPAR